MARRDPWAAGGYGIYLAWKAAYGYEGPADWLVQAAIYLVAFCYIFALIALVNWLDRRLP